MQNEQHTFPVALTLRIDWSEMDEFRHVNNVMFMKYIQSARVNYWQKAGIYDLFTSDKKGPMVLSLTCRFLKPLYFPGTVTIKTSTASMHQTSFHLVHQLFNEANECVAEATDILVMYDFTTNHKLIIPEGIRSNIEKLENRTFTASNESRPNPS